MNIWHGMNLVLEGFECWMNLGAKRTLVSNKSGVEKTLDSTTKASIGNWS